MSTVHSSCERHNSDALRTFARLPSLSSEPLERIAYVETDTHVLLSLTTQSARAYLYVFFTKNDSTLHYTFDFVLHGVEVGTELISRWPQYGKNVVRSGRARAILGFIRFLNGYYIILVVRRHQAAKFGAHRFFEVKQHIMLPLFLDRSSWLQKYFGKLLGVEEKKCVADFQRFEMNRFMYYSHTYDLSNTLQKNMTMGKAVAPRRAFLWNEYLMEPILENAKPWEGIIVQLIRGSICGGVFERPPAGAPSAAIILIARSNRKFAGLRFLRRGINSEGYVANHVEVEQIVFDPHSFHHYETMGSAASYVQVRGSVPVAWSHPLVHRPKPPLSIGAVDPYFVATRKHFGHLLEDHGAPLVIMDLLKRQDRDQERILSRELERAVWVATSDMEEPRCVKYRTYDIRRDTANVWNRMKLFAEASLMENGFFWCTPDGHCRLQHGVVRSNCVDCIDRSNICQFFFGLSFLGPQLAAVGALENECDVVANSTPYELLLSLYFIVGDAIAIQYGGSQHVSSGILKRGLGWDKRMEIQRLYNNILMHKDQQQCTDLFLGVYRPLQHRSAFSQFSTPQRKLWFSFSSFSGKRPHTPQNGDKSFATPEGESEGLFHTDGPLTKIEPWKQRAWWVDPLGSGGERGVAARCRSQFATSAKETGNRQELPWSESDAWYALRRTRLLDAESPSEYEIGLFAELPRGRPHISPTAPWSTQQPLSPTYAMNQLLSGAEYADDASLKHSDQEWRCPLREHKDALQFRYKQEIEAFDMWSDCVANPTRSLRSTTVMEFAAVAAHREVTEAEMSLFFSMLRPLGDPREWTPDMVVEALRRLDPTPPRLVVEQLAKFSGAQLVDFSLDVVEAHFPTDVRYACNFATMVQRIREEFLHSSGQWDTPVGVTEYDPLALLPGNVADCENSCIALQQFFLHAIHPSNVFKKITDIEARMADPLSGIPRRDLLRCDGGVSSDHAIPPHWVLRKVFSASDATDWLQANSAPCGLRLHCAPTQRQRHSRTQLFFQWLLDAGIVKRVLVKEGMVGEERMSLFQLPAVMPESVVNLPKHIDLGFKSRSIAYDGHAALNLAEHLCERALSIMDAVSYAPPSEDLLKYWERSMELLPWVDLSLFSERGKYIFFVNVFNALYAHAWLKWLLVVTGEGAPSAAQTRLPKEQKVAGYRIGSYVLTLVDLKHGILRCNRPPPASFLPCFRPGDARCSLVSDPWKLDRRIHFSLLDLYFTLGDEHGAGGADGPTAVRPFYDATKYFPAAASLASTPSPQPSATSFSPGQGEEGLVHWMEEDAVEEVGMGEGLIQTYAPLLRHFFLGTRRKGVAKHHCVPLTLENYEEVLERNQSLFVRSLFMEPPAKNGAVGGSTRALLPLVGLSEFGMSKEAVQRQIWRMYKSEMGPLKERKERPWSFTNS